MQINYQLAAFFLSDPNDLSNSLSDPSLQNYDKVVLTVSGLPDAAAYTPSGFTGDPIGIGNTINPNGLSSTGASDVYTLNTNTGISDLQGLFLNFKSGLFRPNGPHPFYDCTEC